MRVRGEPSNKDIMKVLQNMNISLNAKLDLLNDTVESLKGVVFDLQQENARLKAQLDQCQKMQEDMKAQVQEAVFNAKLAEERSERNEQTSNCFSSRSQPTLLSRQRRARRKH